MHCNSGSVCLIDLTFAVRRSQCMKGEFTILNRNECPEKESPLFVVLEKVDRNHPQRSF